ncbi:uncharacterized protein LOC114171269 [Vigna unguiculata]|uniref:uncharacterized protein LOC114171269 n=1 Tax=Vigna unguiculata TaxID=3917 RepID=UPI0010163584|nr:uncharacterized protein LOC114171269 [Vigna unguiculata]
MEDWETAQETIKADISQLKDQVGEASSAKGEKSTHDAPIAFPTYGLPSSYTPPVGDYSEAEHASFSFPINTPRNEGTTFAEPRVTVIPKPLNTTIDDDSLGKITPHPTMQSVFVDVEGTKTKLEILEEQLRAIEGGGNYGFGDVAGLSLVRDVTIPHKFKVPEFERYKGTTCPRSHLTMYYRKMAAYAYDDKLLIHFFQDSLAGAALSWYTHLEASRIRSWMDLVDAFLKQYKYNMDIAPDRLQLQNMAKRDAESFKEYAQRWRELAAQVEPPLHDKEMVAMFVSMLQPPFYEHMVGNVSSVFADIIIIGERIEIGLNNGKIAYSPLAATTPKKPDFSLGKKMEVEVHAVSTIPKWENQTFAYQAQSPQQGSYQSQHNNTWKIEANTNPNQSLGQITSPRRNQEKNYIHFTPIPVTYTELLPDLLRNALVAICPMKPLEPPYPKYFDVNATCDYHGGAIGHSTEKCLSYKHKVQALIDSGWLKFQENKPNIKTNPLSGHDNASINAIDLEGRQLVKNVSEIKSSRRFIFEALLTIGLLEGEYNLRDACGFHPGAEHSIEACKKFENFLQNLIDKNFVQVCCGDKDDKRRLVEEKNELSLACIEGRERKKGKICISDIKESFRSVRWINACQISPIEDGNGLESLDFVRSCPPDI